MGVKLKSDWVTAYRCLQEASVCLLLDESSFPACLFGLQMHTLHSLHRFSYTPLLIRKGLMDGPQYPSIHLHKSLPWVMLAGRKDALRRDGVWESLHLAH